MITNETVSREERGQIERTLIVHGAVPLDAAESFIAEEGESLNVSQGKIDGLDDAVARYRGNHASDFIALRANIAGRPEKFIDCYKAVVQARDRAAELALATKRAMSPGRRAQKRGHVNYGGARAYGSVNR